VDHVLAGKTDDEIALLVRAAADKTAQVILVTIREIDVAECVVRENRLNEQMI
jgi:hypothetical protein